MEKTYEVTNIYSTHVHRNNIIGVTSNFSSPTVEEQVAKLYESGRISDQYLKAMFGIENAKDIDEISLAKIKHDLDKLEEIKNKAEDEMNKARAEAADRKLEGTPYIGPLLLWTKKNIFRIFYVLFMVTCLLIGIKHIHNKFRFG